MDKYLIEKADALVGKMQERGTSLPRILQGVTLAFTIGFLGLCASLMTKGETASFILGAFCALCSLAFMAQVRQYASDAEVFEDNRRLHERYRSNALLKRETSWGWRIIEMMLFIYVWANIVFVIMVGVVTPGDVFMLLSVTFGAMKSYCECVFPRHPNLRQKQFAFAGV